MHRRLQRYNVDFWAGEFLHALRHSVSESTQTIKQRSIEKGSYLIENAYQNANKRVLFLDYDGTLVGFSPQPDQARPDEELIQLLEVLVNDPRNTVVIISGRERYDLEEWFQNLNLYIIASHGLWLRYPGQEWIMTTSLDNDWKDPIRYIMELYTDRIPGSLIEEKDYSLAWHYRQSDPDMIAVKLSEVRETLRSIIQAETLGLQEGNKVLEVKDNRVNKGFGAAAFIQNQEYDFIFAVGDDYTDEDLFTSLPQDAYTVKVGLGNISAAYFLKSWQSMRRILKKFADISMSFK